MANASDVVNSRDLILDSARELISANGYDGMVISDLTARSGLPASSIYYHFGNKMGVLAALLERTFAELHASFPSPSSFDDLPALERFERWLRAACASLDARPEYLRLLLAVSVGSMMEEDAVRSTVRRIREHALGSWGEALGPVVQLAGGEGPDASLAELAVLGRAVIDGLAVTASFDGVSYSSHVDAIVGLVRAIAGRGTGAPAASGG